MQQVKTFIFFPDTKNKAGLGHLNRCYKYSEFLDKKKTVFLIQENFPKKYLRPKINYFFYKNISSVIKKINIELTNIFFLDTYDLNIQKKFLNLFKKKLYVVLDFKSKLNFSCIIDHTFDRKRKFHVNHKNQRIYVGHKYFPISKKFQFKKRNIILIDFGSINNNKLINKSLYFIKCLDLQSQYKIIIINKFFSKKYLQADILKKNIQILKYIKNIHSIYQKTLFSIGACGISLYEKSFYFIPTMAIPVAKNQMYNYKNFSKKKCMLKLTEMFKLKNSLNKGDFFHKLKKIEKNLKHNFNIKMNSLTVNKIFAKKNES